MSYAQLDWKLQGGGNDLRYFNRNPREMLGNFCKSVMEDALESAKETKRQSAYDLQCRREEAQKYSIDCLQDVEEANKKEKIEQISQNPLNGPKTH